MKIAKYSISMVSDKKIEKVIENELKKYNVSIYKESPLLYSIPDIKENLLSLKNTFAIRNQFSDFIKKYGLPYLILLDYKIDFGLPKHYDPDKRKLLRTFLIAYVILSKGKGFSNMICNFILVCKKEELKEAQLFARNPTLLLHNIRTQNALVNNLIEEFSVDPEYAREVFRIYPISHDTSISKISSIIREIARNANKYVGMEEDKTLTVDTSDRPPADVIFRISQNEIYISGKKDSIKKYPEYQNYNIGEFYLEGYITAKNILDLRKNILKAVEELKEYIKDKQLIFNLQDNVIVDATTSSFLVSLFSNDLVGYDVSLNLTNNILKKLKSSIGFIPLKEYIVKAI